MQQNKLSLTDHKEAGGIVASLFCQSGIYSALSYLFTHVRSFAPITRMLFYWRNQEARPVAPVHGMTLYPEAHGHIPLRLDLELPVQAVPGGVNLSKYGMIVCNTIDVRNSVLAPDWESYRMHRSFVRLPLFAVADDTVYMGFWADAEDIFTPALIKLLRAVLKPFGQAVRENASAENAGKIMLSRRDKPNALALLHMCPGLGAVQRKVERIAPTSSTVLILGETGVGKEVVADAIHMLSRRRQGPFVKVNCGAIPETLIDSELFGHEKGAYTGAHTSRPGFFEQANGGTIFLDEIGELTLHSQVRLLRVLERREIQRVGSVSNIPLDIRIIAATHRNLAAMVENGSFREDLWYRLNVFPVDIPPLRKRGCDIALLVHHFIHLKAPGLGLETLPPLKPEDLDQLHNHHWPGNVRELEFVVERAMVNAAANSRNNRILFEIDSSRIPQTRTVQNSSAESAWPSLEEYINSYVLRVMEKTHGRLYGADGAAEILHVHPNTLRSRLDKLGIPVAHKRG